MLYSADVDSLAKPVSVSEKVAKKAPRKKRKTLDQQMVEKQLEIKEKEKELEEALKKPTEIVKEEKPVTPPPSIAEVEVCLEKPIEKPVDKPIEKPVDKPVEKIKVSKDDNDPPAWFKTFISNAKQQESRIKEPKKPRKQVKVEAEKIAQQQWNDEYTRNRYNQQADQHMRKMHQLYNQMFYR